MERCNKPLPKSGPRAEGAPPSLLEMGPVKPPPGWTRSAYGGGGNYRGGGGGYNDYYGGGGGGYDSGYYDPYYGGNVGGGYQDYGGGGGGCDDYSCYGSSRGGRGGRPMRSGRGMGGGGRGRGRVTPYERPPNKMQPDFGGGGGSGGGQGACTRVQMRGLPYRCTPSEIEEFFVPLPVTDILIGYGEDERPSGDGAVEFETPVDAREAMKRNHNTMGKRYIELFLGYNGVPGSRSRLRSVMKKRPVPSATGPQMLPGAAGDYGVGYNCNQNYDYSGDPYASSYGGGYGQPIAQQSSHGQQSYPQQNWFQSSAQAAQAMAAANWQSQPGGGPEPVPKPNMLM